MFLYNQFNALIFLTLCYHGNCVFNTIAGFRSAVSAYHKPTDGFLMGQHPKMSALFP